MPRSWIEMSPYTATLGIAVESLSEQAATLVLPFKDENANPGRALHGGCAASLAIAGAQALARTALGDGSGPWHTFGLQVNYLSAAIGEDVRARARLLRKGKELCFVEVDVATADGKPIAHASAGGRARFGAEAARLVHARGDDGAAGTGAMGPPHGEN